MMTMGNNKIIGDKGEALAIQFFEERAYTILEKNWRHSRYELDLIASKNNTLHIIEVKTRTSTFFGAPHEGVTDKKFEKILKGAEAYLYEHPQWTKVQYDVLAIFLPKNGVAQFELLEDFFI
jgi:putative endonuclease